MGDSIETFDKMIGAVMTSVTGEVNGEVMIFTAEDGATHRFHHYQDCCESVEINDICGDLSDLVGSPIVQAEAVEGDSGRTDDGYDSCTWTFYKFATVKGSVTVRWLGQSNGYYSESVSYDYKAAK
jgi:hypothetical protein